MMSFNFTFKFEEQDKARCIIKVLISHANIVIELKFYAVSVIQMMCMHIAIVPMVIILMLFDVM